MPPEDLTIRHPTEADSYGRSDTSWSRCSRSGMHTDSLPVLSDASTQRGAAAKVASIEPRGQACPDIDHLSQGLSLLQTLQLYEGLNSSKLSSSPPDSGQSSGIADAPHYGAGPPRYN